MKTGIAFAIALALAGNPAVAQQHDHGSQADSGSANQMACRSDMMNMMGMVQMLGERGQPGMMQGEDMRAMAAHQIMRDVMRLMPHRVLALRDSLGLDAEQVHHLEALRTELLQSQPDDAMMRRHEALRRAFEAKHPDPLGVRVATEELMSSHAQIHAAQIVAAATVRGLLTGPQRERLEGLMPCPMNPGEMNGMMPHGMMRDRHDRDSPNDASHARR
ncbi:MAG TPA: hypothetical protein VGA37_06975 [Gemmatimonadales bacterium]